MARLGYRLVANRLRTDCRLAPATDAELLARFAAARDEGAFAELVARHAGLVRGTARRALRDPHAAEDVYQATFLVLARKAGSVRWGATVGPWLHATAVRLARKAASRSTPAPAVATDRPAERVDPAAAAAWGEVCRALDEEVAALPEVLRGPLVLCYLQDRTRDEAAAALGCSLAMLKRRLERGRNLLRDRLTRRGVALPAVGAAVLIADLPASASVVANTARAAVEYAASGMVPAGTAALLAASRGGQWVKAMALAAGLAICGLGLGAFSGTPETDSRDDPKAAPTAAEPPKTDAAADPLPPGAVARLGTLRLRPGASVEHLAFSPDGTKLASWVNDLYVNDSLIIWDT